jgi:peptidyl-prolyl cis-trans isomerase B (cyclophilin B)
VSFAVRSLAAASLVACIAAAGYLPQPDAAAGPVIVVETPKGTFAIETFPNEAPKTVAHIVDLAKRGFYDGQRVHRAIPGFVAQFGDPQTRDTSKRELWGRGAGASSGAPIGAAEFSKKHLNVKGAVGVAHQGVPANGDSQIYIALDDRPDLDNKYVVFGQVIEGGDVPPQLQVGDTISKMSVRP